MFFDSLERHPKDGEKVKIRFRSGQQFEADRVVKDVEKIEGSEITLLGGSDYAVVWSPKVDELFQKSTATFEIMGRVS
jgi:hypothetical protein